MGFGSIWHWVIVLVIVLLLFGAGRVPRLMGDLAKGIRSFKDGMKSDGTDEAKADERSSATIDAKPSAVNVEEDRTRSTSKS